MPTSAAQMEVLRTLSLLHPLGVSCGKVRTGGPHDGGYVMANDFRDNRIAYSIGVGPQVEWDVEMANRGLHIYQYDHTVEGLPAQHPNFHYAKIGIGPDLSDPELVTLERMLEDNEHVDEENMLLKIDVEGAEWDVFDKMSSNTLAKFDQVVVEYHGFEFLGQDSFRTRADRVFQVLNHTHQVIHIHGNNYANFAMIQNIPVPHVLEVSYARKGRFEFCESTDVFPTHLDEPCRWDEPDLYLGDFKYKVR